MGQCVHHFDEKEPGFGKLVSWQPDIVTSAAHGAMVISLWVSGSVNLHKALLRQLLDVLPALENWHTPEVHIWWLQQPKSLANPWCHTDDWILIFAVRCSLDTVFM